MLGTGARLHAPARGPSHPLAPAGAYCIQGRVEAVTSYEANWPRQPAGPFLWANRLRGSWQRSPAFGALSCGRDRVRWPVPLAVFCSGSPVAEPVALAATPGAAGSRMFARIMSHLA